ncbi:MAG: 4-hydroxy-tetrahydrodipicolinate synthase [Ilumatobacteraceae bacterium]
MATAPFIPEGLWLPIITPFSDDGNVDFESLQRVAERLLGDGVDGLVPLGTTGEPATLSSAERDRVVEVCSAACRLFDKPLIVGAGSNSTPGTLEEIRRLADLAPVAAALIVVPYYTRPSRQAIIDHFHLVADESPIPLIAYNVPYRTGSSLDADALVAIGSHPNIVGLKQAVGMVDEPTLDLLRRTPDDFNVLAGDDLFIVPSILMGAAGAIAAAAHLCTPTFVAMVAAASNGEVTMARDLARSLHPVVTAGFSEPNPAVWKGALHQRGDIGSPGLRRPMTAASDPAVARAVAAVAALESV